MKKILIAMLMLLSLPGLLSTAFASTEPSSWASSFVNEIRNSKDIKVDRLLGNYQNSITRAEFAYLAVNLYEYYTGRALTVGTSAFTDTSDPYVLKAKNAGIVSGYPDGTFKPTNKIRRDELATLFINLLKSAQISYKTTISQKFSDDPLIASWAKESVYLARENGMISGVGGNNFDPAGNASIEQSLIILYKGMTQFQKPGPVLNEAKIDDTFKNKGLIRISYSGSITDKIKVMIAKDDNKYYYPLQPNGKMVGFPLQMGNGDYRVSVLKHVVDNKYASVKTTTVNLQLKDPNLVYLNSIQIIEWSSTSDAVLKNQVIVGNETNVGKRINLGYDFVVKNIKYDFNKISSLTSDYIPDPDSTLRALSGICYDYASLLAAMKRSEGAPVKLVKGYTKNVEGYHAWNEIFLDGKWVIVDTTVDAAFYGAKQKFSFAKPASDYTKIYEY